MVLGLPWSRKYAPTIDWSTGTILGYRPPTIDLTNTEQVMATDLSIGIFLKMAQTLLFGVLAAMAQLGGYQDLPPVLEDYADVCSKVNAAILPDHGSFDHKIDLEPGTIPPFGPLYKLSLKELEVFDSGAIMPFEASASAPILFVKKKDSSPSLCVDY